MIEVWVLILIAFFAWIFNLGKDAAKEASRPPMVPFRNHYRELKVPKEICRDVYLKDYAGQIRYAREMYFKLKEEFYRDHPIGSHYAYALNEGMDHFIIENENDQASAFGREYRESRWGDKGPWDYCICLSRLDAIERGYAPDNCSGYVRGKDLKRYYSLDMYHGLSPVSYPRDWRDQPLSLKPDWHHLYLGEKELDAQHKKEYNKLLDAWDEKSRKVNQDTEYFLSIGYIHK